MATITLRPTAPAVLAPQVASEPLAPVVSSQLNWLVGPAFDLLLVANVAWPLLLLAQLGEGFEGRSGVQFWQLYFVTTPHRWITLAIVFLDRERFEARRRTFLTIAALVIVACLSVRFTTGTLTCLLAIDYLWNGWHFAAQHHGIYRIYDRLRPRAVSHGGSAEKWVMRLFLMYVILRVAGMTWAYPALEQAAAVCDWGALAIAVGMLCYKLSSKFSGGMGSPADASPGAGQVVYLISVLSLYSCLLGAVHWQQPRLVLTLATAAALFHAVEYLSVVSWAVRQRHRKAADRMGLMAYLAPRWALTLAIFVLVLGAGGWLMDQQWMEAWLLLNVVAAFLHYAYDGLIWRKPAGAGGT